MCYSRIRTETWIPSCPPASAKMFDIRLPRGERSFDAPSTFFRRDGGEGRGGGGRRGGNANRLGSKIAVMEEFERWEIRKGMGREKTSGKMSRGKRKISNGIKDEKGKGIEKNGRVTREYLKLGGRWEREKGIVISRKFAACRFFRVLYSQRFSIRGIYWFPRSTNEFHRDLPRGEF